MLEGHAMGGFRLVHARFQGPMTQMKNEAPSPCRYQPITNRGRYVLSVARLHESVYSIGFLAHRPFFFSYPPIRSTSFLSFDTEKE